MNIWSSDSLDNEEPIRMTVPQRPCYSSFRYNLPEFTPLSFRMHNPLMLASMYNSTHGVNDPRPQAMLQPDIDELIKAMNGLQSIRLVIMVSPRHALGPPSPADHLTQRPGYPDHVEEVSLRTPDNKQWVTRLGLRGNISRAYEAFFKVRTLSLSSSERQCSLTLHFLHFQHAYVFYKSEVSQWAVGSCRTSLDMLTVVELKHCGSDCFQAVVELTIPQKLKWF